MRARNGLGALQGSAPAWCLSSSPSPPAHRRRLQPSPPRLAACDAHGRVTHGSIFYSPACRQRRHLGAARALTLPPSPSPPRRCHLLAAIPEGIMEGGSEQQRGEASRRLQPDVSLPGRSGELRCCCTHRCCLLARNKADAAACIPAQHPSGCGGAAQELQRRDAAAEVCGLLSRGLWGCI